MRELIIVFVGLTFAQLAGCSNDRGTSSCYILGDFRLGLSISDLDAGHPGAYAFRRLLLRGSEFQTWSGRAAGWEHVQVDASSNASGAKISKITADTSSDHEALWRSTTESIIRSCGKPDNRILQHDDSGGRKEILTWGKVQVKSQDGKYVQILTDFQAKERCIVASHTTGDDARGFCMIEVMDPSIYGK